jgi:hypothetical protein
MMPYGRKQPIFTAYLQADNPLTFYQLLLVQAADGGEGPATPSGRGG